MIKDLTDETFKKKIFNYEEGEDAPLLIPQNTVIEFWVTWCPHCQAMRPRFEKVSQLHSDIDFYRIEMEDYPELADLFNISGFPTFVFLSPDGTLHRTSGEMSSQELEENIEEAF